MVTNELSPNFLISELRYGGSCPVPNVVSALSTPGTPNPKSARKRHLTRFDGRRA